MAGCASSPQTTETALPPTTTPDPLALQCIHESGRHDFCYAGDLVAEDTALLEEATRTFCWNNDNFWCSIYIWRDEENVADGLPLTDAETSSLIALYTLNPNSGVECFRAYRDGEVIYSSGECN